MTVFALLKFRHVRKIYCQWEGEIRVGKGVFLNLY